MTGLRQLRRRVEHVDTDAGGVVHFSRYASLLETAVLENLDRLGVGVRQLTDQGLELAVRDLRMSYRASARFLDRLRVDVQVDRVAGATCELSGAVHREPDGDVAGELLATGALVLCVVDRAGGQAVALPAPLRRALRECRHERQAPTAAEGDRDE
ncbi:MULTISPECIES: thioesterase family protein [unclassified Micromonospora]|uniref:acyl-CoA thioesterase n=1 Tax=unclassified Micromonospora TaxID=2617518 RepID=UPI0010487E7E|nr:MULTISPECIES: thioesterase family protein [unclassified Micromonospora]TDB81629.1 acyl-CoA thioesterase [Micromonospora sp. KC721]TDC42942.1 acyl-CoA thioesterase [Micromonospora sp. KC213]